MDSEQWKQIELPGVFQRLIDQFEETGNLRDISTINELDAMADVSLNSTISTLSSTSATVSSAISDNEKRDYVLLNNEKFIVVG